MEEKEKQRERGQILQQRFSIWFLKLPQKILKSLRGPAQDDELAGRMAQGYKATIHLWVLALQ